MLITCGNKTVSFVIEAKRNGKRLTEADVKQARNYGKSTKAPFVAITNGQEIRVFHTISGKAIQWNGKLADKIPSRDQLDDVIKFMRTHKDAIDIPLGKNDASLPFRPSLPLKQLNDLFARCHNRIRNIEKSEDYAFADFSKLLFLKLLEEKAEMGEFELPYSYRFWELADQPPAQADQVKTAILTMLKEIKDKGYSDVLIEGLHMKQANTFQFIVKELSEVSFSDSGYDIKGAAFEYFIRATLHGKKLGQYFTPRPVVDLMAGLTHTEAILNALLAGTEVLVADPACGTGGFLIRMLKDSLNQLDIKLANREISQATYNDIASKLSKEVFHGSDANESVASAAKMNMIIAGDGHNNITAENSLSLDASIWPVVQENGVINESESGKYDYILTNPPFGTAEGDALSKADSMLYPVQGGKGQHLFLQRMILATKPGGLICTVIDDGVLNTETGVELRRWIMQRAKIIAIMQLPEVTFKPNKINIRSSVLLMQRRENNDIDLLDPDPVTFINLKTLGYIGTGEAIRGFSFMTMRDDLIANALNHEMGSPREGEYWHAFDVSTICIATDNTSRWDSKYWSPEVVLQTQKLLASGAVPIVDLNILETKRGRSPQKSTYVDAPDGYAVVVKAGNVSRYGVIEITDADWIEKQTYDEMPRDIRLEKNDVLLASTGDGTLGKAGVWDHDERAIADGHVTILRVNESEIVPDYLADYLRLGFGSDQIQRLFTGSTGLIELTPDHVKQIVVPLLKSKKEQSLLSKQLRDAEQAQIRARNKAEFSLETSRDEFWRASMKESIED